MLATRIDLTYMHWLLFIGTINIRRWRRIYRSTRGHGQTCIVAAARAEGLAKRVRRTGCPRWGCRQRGHRRSGRRCRRSRRRGRRSCWRRRRDRGRCRCCCCCCRCRCSGASVAPSESRWRWPGTCRTRPAGWPRPPCTGWQQRRWSNSCWHWGGWRGRPRWHPPSCWPPPCRCTRAAPRRLCGTTKMTRENINKMDDLNTV